MDKKAETPDTLEQAIDRIYPPHPPTRDLRTPRNYKAEGFKAGAEWQQKRSFSLEDARRIWDGAIGYFTDDPTYYKKLDDYFNRFMQENFPEKV